MKATADNVQKWFDERLEDTPRDMEERITSAISSVKYKTWVKDPAGAAMGFIIDIVTALDQNNASEVLKDQHRAKIVDDVHPALLRERVKRKLAYWTKTQQGDIGYF